MSMKKAFVDYYRCPENLVDVQLAGELSPDAGYFRCGPDTICYGHSTLGSPSARAEDPLVDVADAIKLERGSVLLPFDPDDVAENLRRERYTAHFRDDKRFINELIRKVYYLIRPMLSVSVRKYLQRAHLRKWHQIAFPEWPVDTTVDRLHQQVMAQVIEATGLDSVPFIWFWPDEFLSCAIITHDVEEADGRDFTGTLMDIDAAFGFRSSFQVVPENRYSVPKSYLEQITGRGFEVNVHDLKHDGRLYAEHEEFLRRAAKINGYGRQFGASGFRSGILYRNADWYDAFDFLYDMSIPNVAHLDPQRGGCCTVMPYHIGKMVELPVTCTQDYTLFHMLNDYSIDIWKRQIALIREHHGLITVLTHPDYLMEAKPQETYKSLLQHLAQIRDHDHMWTPLPGEVARWWEQRSRMQLVQRDGAWTIEGPGQERARIAFAVREPDGSVAYRFAAPASHGTPAAFTGSSLL
ncbi:MAG: hypothetical protein WCA37_15260 [Terracidiphilus sp.]